MCVMHAAVVCVKGAECTASKLDLRRFILVKLSFDANERCEGQHTTFDLT